MYQTLLVKGKLAKDVQSLKTRAEKYFNERGLSLESVDKKKISQGSYLNGLFRF